MLIRAALVNIIASYGRNNINVRGRAHGKFFEDAGNSNPERLKNFKKDSSLKLNSSIMAIEMTIIQRTFKKVGKIFSLVAIPYHMDSSNWDPEYVETIA